MSLLTSFLKLFKFTDEGIFDITRVDDNMDKLDTAIKNLSEGKEPTIIKKSGFNLAISDLVNSTSSIILASAKAVKTAYDKAVEAVNLTKTNKAAILNNTEQIERLDDYATAIVGVNQNTRIAVGNASTSIKTNMVPNRLYQVFIHHGVSDGCGLWYVFYTPNGQKQFKVFATNYIETNIEIWQNLSGSLTINNKSGTNVEVDISAHTTGVNRTNDIDKF